MIRTPLLALTAKPEDKLLRSADSLQHYLPSTISTTSGLGSNYTNTSGPSSCLSGGNGGGGTQPPTPSPRRKSSTTSFIEYADLPEERESRSGLYIPGDYVNYPQQNMETFGSTSGYFGKWITNYKHNQ